MFLSYIQCLLSMKWFYCKHVTDSNAGAKFVFTYKWSSIGIVRQNAGYIFRYAKPLLPYRGTHELVYNCIANGFQVVPRHASNCVGVIILVFPPIPWRVVVIIVWPRLQFHLNITVISYLIRCLIIETTFDFRKVMHYNVKLLNSWSTH